MTITQHDANTTTAVKLTNNHSVKVAGKMNNMLAVSNVKRVATLYRVSTKKQLDKVSDKNGVDIVGQRKSCMDFIARQEDWEFVKEYMEAGVSGFKVEASKRDAIQDAKKDAEKGLFDVLLVFKFDRLGRKDDETPFVLQWFVKKGIEMWSVVEGQQKIDNHMDRLVNYLTFWKASGESENISIRVNEKLSQMVEDGIYRGGTVPFGYITVRSGKFNKKGKELLKVVIDPEQAKILNWIYDLVDQEGYGQYRIAKLLNEKGIKTNTGKNWSSSAINVLLRNPLYKGYMVYARGTEKEVFSKKQIEELVIIDEAKWNRVQTIREKRNPDNIVDKENPCIIKTTKGKLLLVGMTRCGYCGSPLTTTYHKKSYTRKDGTKRATRSAKYRCSGKAHQKVDCSGQTTYSPIRIEGAVLDEIYAYLEQLKTVDLTSQIENLKKQNMGEETKELGKYKKELSKADSDLAGLKNEVIKVINGESSFDREMLSGMIKDKENQILELNETIEKLEKQLESKKVEHAELEALQKHCNR